MKIRLADYVANFLVEHGISDCFTVTGGGAMHLNDALGHKDGLRCTYNHHEQACAIAAEAYARINNKIALVCVTTGPGGTNAITGVVGGWLDSIPMLVISGQVRYDTTARGMGLGIRAGGDQEFDITKSISCMTKYSEMIEDRINAKKGSFTAKSEASAHFMTQSNKQTVTNQVTFERKGKDLTFEVEQKTDDQTTIITYADGKKREERNGIVTPESMSDDEAEQYLTDLANDPLMGYNPNYVTDIKKTDEGYEITMDVSSSSALGQIITSSGAKFSSGRHTIRIKVDDGKITSIEHAYSASGSVSLGYGNTATLKYTGSSDVTFD